MLEEIKIHYNEIPETTFRDELEACKVTMLDYPDEKRIKRVLVEFVLSSWVNNSTKNLTDEEVDRVIQELLKGNTLPLGLETMKFTFLVEGVSLHTTHAIVRSRIGMTYAQVSQGTRDLRHEDIIIPRAFGKDKKLLEAYKQWCLRGKELYAKMIDSEMIATPEARYCLSKGLVNHIYISGNLMALSNFIAKRSCKMEEPDVHNKIAQEMRRLILEKFPFLKNFLKSACEKRSCLHLKPGFFASAIFKRDKYHRIEGEDESYTLLEHTKEWYTKGEPIKEETYIGYQLKERK